MNKGWIQIKEMLINLDQVSAVQVSEDSIRIFSHGAPLARFKKGLTNDVETITTEEFDKVSTELEARLTIPEAI